LEHTRHEFLTEQHVSFSELHTQGIDAVVSRVEIMYKTSLKPDDVFVSKLFVEKQGVKYVFYQAIYRKTDNALCIKAKVEIVVLIAGRLAKGLEIFDKLIDSAKNKDF
jgi:acyl-CoA thioester hydrolase